MSDIELYATAKAAQETETLKREIQAYELTVQNLRNGLAQAWEEACEQQRKHTYTTLGFSSKPFLYPRDYNEIIEWLESGGKPTNPYKQEKP